MISRFLFYLLLLVFFQFRAAEFFPFLPNAGQVSNQYYKPHPEVHFVAHINQLHYAFKSGSWSIQQYKISENGFHSLFGGIKTIPKHSIETYRTDWIFINSQSVKPEAQNPSPDFENYYSEICPKGVTGIHRYSEIRYKQLYKGIDAVFSTETNRLKYQFEIKNPSDYVKIKMECRGADTLYVNHQGQLVIVTPFGILIDEPPIAFQQGSKLPAQWQVQGPVVSFKLNNFDPNLPLIIDPLVRAWGTYYGATFTDYMSYTCIDPMGNLFTSGYTESPTSLNIATVGSHQSSYGGGVNTNFPGDGFLVKINAQGQRLWATYYGGSGNDYSNMVCTDTLGNVYMVGVTSSTNTGVIATPGAYQTLYAGGSNNGDGFLAKFNSSGQRLWGTYYGDTGDDWVIGACINASQQLYISGGSFNVNASYFGSPGSHQPQHYGIGGNGDAYLSKFNSGGQRLWSTYYGGSNYDNGHYCVVDAADRVTLLGATNSTETNVIASPGAHQANYGGGTNYGDAFMVQFSGNGTRLWSSYYGGPQDDYASAGVTDASGNLIITGITSTSMSGIISSSLAFQPQYGGGSSDAFLLKFSVSGQRIWGTYVGGSLTEGWPFVDQHASGNIYLTGETSSTTGISTPCSYQEIYGGGARDVFFSQWDSNGQQRWSSYYGGSGADGIWPSLVVDNGQNIYLVGSTTSPSGTAIASPGSHQPQYASNNNLTGTSGDGFMVKFPPCQAQTPAVIAQTIACSATRAVLTAAQTCGLRWYDAAVGGSLMSSSAQFTTPVLAQTATYYVEDVSCGYASQRSAIQVSVLASPSIVLTAAKNPICKGDEVVLSVSGAPQFIWQGLATTASSLLISPTVTVIYTVVGTAANGCSDTKTLGLVVNPCNSVNNEPFEQIIRVYPNPAQTEITLLTESFQQQSKEPELIYLRDVMGRTMGVYQLVSKQTTLSIHTLTPGFYWIYFNGSFKPLKFLKQ